MYKGAYLCYNREVLLNKECKMKEFFGFGGYMREPEGFMSWQHLTFVSSLVVLMVAFAVFLGRRNRDVDFKRKNRVLKIAAIAIDGVELFKIVLMCFRAQDPLAWLYELPLFLCSIQLIALPVAAFSKGRLQEAALDFVSIFGMLGALLGTYGAGQNYNAYPVLGFDNVVSGITHTIAGFAALYILIVGMASMKRRNIGVTFGILGCFCIAAYIANLLLDYNYMFLMNHDGTPYVIFYNLVKGSPVLYPMIVVLLFVLWIGIFYGVYHAVFKKHAAKKQAETQAAPDEMLLHH